MKLLLSILACILLSVNAVSQTAGSGDVAAIEAKAAQYTGNINSINQMKAELPGLTALWQEKLKKLKDEITQLTTDRDNLIADMKIGAKCSKCGEYKSEFEKRGQNFGKHLGEVSGYAIPATTDELEATRAEFREKIAVKKVQLQALEKGDKAYIQKMEAISKLEEENKKICEQITAYSKSYETKVIAEAKSKHELWTNELLNYAIAILVADDKITIYKARISRYEKEFQEESLKVKEQVKKDNTREQELRKNKVTANLSQAETIKTERINYLTPLKTKLSELRAQETKLSGELKNLQTGDTLKVQLESSQAQLLTQISAIEKSIADYNTLTESKLASLDKENKTLNNEVFQLTGELTKQQTDAVSRIKPAYDAKKAEAAAMVTSSTTEHTAAKKLYNEKAAYYKKLNQDYHAIVSTEGNRMLTASQPLACPVYNDARGAVMTNWNQVFPCVNGITTMAKPYSTNIFNSYCPGKSTAEYMSAYKSFLRGLDTNDKEAVRGNSNAAWFDLMQ